MTFKAGISTNFGHLNQWSVDSNLVTLKNHQGWSINRQLDVKTGAPVFHLVDSYGLPHRVTEFIVENVGPYFGHEFIRLNTLEQQQWIIQYLQDKLNQAGSYQVHIERYGDC